MNYNQLGHTCVVGLQWGDEGKGKVVDLLTEHFDVVVRYGGGANAGHTVRIGEEKFALHLIPSGILRPHVLSIIGPGVVVDLEVLAQEIAGLRARGVKVDSNLLISNRAHLVMPYHKKQDRLAEASQNNAGRIGTTAKGIGPCYADKMLRTPAFRMEDLYRPADFQAKLECVVAERNALFAALYHDHEPLSAQEIARTWLEYASSMGIHVADTTSVLRDALAAKRRVLFEGAQGSLLDINHGTFPFVTSSVCTSGGAAAGAGVAPSVIKSYVGVVKAYTTRVGGGPFPTELNDATGERIRQRGHEYGTTTGRPRRCGWFDAFAVRYAVEMNGITELAIMHLDTLGTFPEVKICTGYRHQGRDLAAFPSDIRVLAEVEPVYETLAGWDGELSACRDAGQLPSTAQAYLDRVEQLVNAPITLASVGADRVAVVHRTSRLR